MPGETRAPPASGPPPPSYALISRVYRHSLRPVVLSVSIISCAYAGICGVSAFQDIHNDNTISARIGTLDIVMGALYMGILGIELFGIMAVLKQIPTAVKTYCYLTLAATLITMTTEMLHVVIHFKFKNTIIQNCITVVTTTGGVCDGPFCQDQPLSLSDGTDYCNSSWSRNSFSDIAWFLVASLFAFLFSSFAWGYLHQLQAVGTRIGVGPGVGGVEGRGTGVSHIPLETWNVPRYEPPSYPPPSGPPPAPRDSTDEEARLHGHEHDDSAKVPEYDGYNAGKYAGDEKAPGYETAIDDSKRVEEEDGEHGPRVGTGTNPFRR